MWELTVWKHHIICSNSKNTEVIVSFSHQTESYWPGDRIDKKLTIFVTCPTKPASAAQNLCKMVQVQGCSPDSPSIPQNALSPVGIPLKKRRLGYHAINLAALRRVRAWGDGRPSEARRMSAEWRECWPSPAPNSDSFDCVIAARNKTHSTRSAPLCYGQPKCVPSGCH